MYCCGHDSLSTNTLFSKWIWDCENCNTNQKWREFAPKLRVKLGRRSPFPVCKALFQVSIPQLAVNVCRKVKIFYANKRYLQKPNNDQSNHKECFFFFMFTLFFHPEIIYITHKCIDSSKVKRLTKISQVAKNVQDTWVFTCNIVEILKYLQTCLGPQRLGHVMFYHFFTGGSVPSPRYQANWPTSLKCQRAFITHTITNVCSEIGLLK